MGRITTRNHPQSEIEKLERRVTALETNNPLNNASSSGQVRFHGEAALLLEGSAEVQAGEYTLSPAGLMLPWNDGRFGLGTVLSAIDGRARAAGDAASAAQSRADSAHNRIDTVSNNASNAMNRANTAHDRIDTVSSNLSTVSTRATNALNAANTAQSRADSAWNLANGRVTQTQRDVLVAKINQIIAVMATEGSNPKPPPIQG